MFSELITWTRTNPAIKCMQIRGVSKSTTNSDIEIKKANPRDTVHENRSAGICMQTGLKCSAVTQQESEKIPSVGGRGGG